MSWLKLLLTAISSLVLFLRERISLTAKAKRKAYEKAEKTIDSDSDTADLQSDIDDIYNGL